MSDNTTGNPIPLTVGDEYEYVVPGASEKGTTFLLENAPTGMMIQPRSGYLHWTPASDTTFREITVTIIREINGETNTNEITFNVSDVENPLAPKPGIYVATDGKNSNSGTIDKPLLSLHKAVQKAQPGDTIYLRGGVYKNDDFNLSFAESPNKRSSLVRITTSGTKESWITIRPHGNEYVKLKSDVTGIAFKNASYWRIQGIELEGMTQDPENLKKDPQEGVEEQYKVEEPEIKALTQDEIDELTQDEVDKKLSDWWQVKSLSLWWNQYKNGELGKLNKDTIQIKAWGIAMNGSSHIEISDCVIHNFPGAGLANNQGANITLSNSIVYNNTWWSTDGSHGFANSKPTTEEEDTSDYKMVMTGNLVFGNQSSMISNVFSTINYEDVKLIIDEGNGLHMQNTQKKFDGAFLIKNNLIIYNGKAGLGLNRIGNATICNNSFYQNAQAVENNGELAIQYLNFDSTVANPDTIEKNLFHPLDNRNTIKSIGLGNNPANPYPGIEDNYTTPGIDQVKLTGHMNIVASVFKDPDPDKFNFSPASPITADYGVEENVLNSIASKVKEYGLVIQSAITKVNPEYLVSLKTAIFKTWPEIYKEVPRKDSGTDDVAMEILKIKDPETGDYTYEQRGEYPRDPETPTS